MGTEQLSPADHTTTTSLAGYLHRIEYRTIGLISRRKYWFALADTTPFLFIYKDNEDVKSVGKIALAGAAFTFDPKEKGRFEIHSHDVVYILECDTNEQRSEWLRALQNTRKKSWIGDKSRQSSSMDIVSLTRAATPSSSDLLSMGGSSSPIPPPRPSKQVEIEHATEGVLIEIEEDVKPDEKGDDSHDMQTGPIEIQTDEMEEEIAGSSEWYLSTDGKLNEKSLEMPEAVESPEEKILKLADKTKTEGIEAPLRAIRRNLTNVWKRRSVDEPAKEPVVVKVTSEDNVIELRDRIESLQEVVESLRTALVASQRQNDVLKEVTSIAGSEEMKEYLLEKERQLTESQMAGNRNARKVQDLEEEKSLLEDQIDDLQQSVEAFRESLRTKEELILKLCEEESSLKTFCKVRDKKVNQTVGGQRLAKFLTGTMRGALFIG